MFYFSSGPRKSFNDMVRIDYEAYWRDRGFSINKKLKEREVIMLADIPAGASVIDIGCGNSLLPLKLKEKGCIVAVADISSIVLEEYKKLGIETHKVNLEDAQSISFAKNFDYIIMSEVLEHTKNPEEILKALRPYTRKFYLTVPNSAFYRYRFHLMFTGRFLQQWVHHPSEHVRYWSHIDFLDWLKVLGFKVLKTESSNGFSLFGIKFFKYFPNMFGHQICYLVEALPQ